MRVGAHREQDVHSPDLQALASRHGRKRLNSRVLQHFSSSGSPVEREVMVQAVITGEGQEA